MESRKQPALGDVIDLSLDGHQQWLLWVGPVVLPELLFRYLAHLHRLRQRRRRWRLRLQPTVRGRARRKETGPDLVDRHRRSHAGEHGQRGRALRRLPQLSHCSTPSKPSDSGGEFHTREFQGLSAGAGEERAYASPGP